MDNSDWDTILKSSEVFRNYVDNELAKEAQVSTNEDEMLEAIIELEAFAEGVKNSPQKLAIFKNFQKRFASEPEYTATVHPSFVTAVMMLKLD